MFFFFYLSSSSLILDGLANLFVYFSSIAALDVYDQYRTY